MELKTLFKIEDKQRLQELYLSQYSSRYIRNEINDIIRACRNISPNEYLATKRISTREALCFIKQNGVPNGYMLSEELQEKMKLV